MSDFRLKAYTCNPDAFIEEFASHTNEMENKRFCFLLGAGASKASGISLGGELALDWLKELHKQEAPSDLPLEEWASSENLGIPDFRLDRAGDFYTRIFERRFEGRMDDGQFWLEKKFGTALPSTGYYFLAQILGSSRHKVVITTNFDNLVADAVLQLTGNLPRIISDARIARFLSPQPRLPIIAKVHGDIGFATTINTTDGIASLDKEWKDPLRRILELYVPLVIGWEGNDGSLIEFFKNEMVDSHGQSLLPSGIFWCYRGNKPWQDRLAANPKLADLARVHTIRFIKTDGFDEWMLRLARSITKADPLETLQDQQKRRLDKFEGNLREELAHSNKIPENPSYVTSKQAKEPGSISLMLRIHDAIQESEPTIRIEKLRQVVQSNPESAIAHGALAAELHYNNEASIEAEEHYKAAISLDPNNANILGNYALFLDRRKNEEEAEAVHLKAIEADPSHSNNLSNFASFCDYRRKDNEKAEEFHLKAISANPNSARSLCNYGIFLETRRKDDDKALELYLRAIAANPDHAHSLRSYAGFLETQRKDYDMAQEFYLRAISVDPTSARSLSNYGLFLETRRKDDDKAEEFYLRAIATDPDHANSLRSYASFLETQRKDNDKAEEFYLRAISADPDHANSLSAYAFFLEIRRKDDDKAEKFYLRAIDADPDHANSLTSYASFLETQRKDDDKAEKLYLRAIAADPDHVDSLRSYASFLETQRKDDDKAEQFYLKAIAADPDHVTSLASYASFLEARRKDDDKAEEFYLRAIAADPEHASSLGNYANFLASKRKSIENAEGLFTRALRSAPNNLTTAANYAEFLLLHRHPDQAAEYIKTLDQQNLHLGSYDKSDIAAILWISAVLATHNDRPNDEILASLKNVITDSDYQSSFSYSDLINWVTRNLKDDAATFWTAVAHSCETKEKLESADQFQKWKDLKPNPSGSRILFSPPVK